MPALRNYTVTQEREIQVRAINVLEASTIAHYIFENKPVPENLVSDTIIFPHPDSITVRNLTVREDY